MSSIECCTVCRSSTRSNLSDDWLLRCWVRIHYLITWILIFSKTSRVISGTPSLKGTCRSRTGPLDGCIVAAELALDSRLFEIELTRLRFQFNVCRKSRKVLFDSSNFLTPNLGTLVATPGTFEFGYMNCTGETIPDRLKEYLLVCFVEASP